MSIAHPRERTATLLRDFGSGVDAGRKRRIPAPKILRQSCGEAA